MGLTENVKQELITVGAGKTSVRTAELATVLRFAGGLHTISGRIAVEAELDSQELATRVRKDLAEIAAFGDAAYSREELVAEMGAAFLAASAAVLATALKLASATSDACLTAF